MLSSFGALAGMASEASAAEKTENSAQNASNTFDVIVLGCGIAGLVAALQAKAEGASVALFEKMDRPAGNAICALGGFCAWGSRHQIAQGVKDNAKKRFLRCHDGHLCRPCGSCSYKNLYR